SHLKAASKQFKAQAVINYVSPMEIVKDDKICLTPSINMPSFNSITINDKIVTPPNNLSESLNSIKSYKSPVDGLRSLNVMRKTYCEFKNKIRILSCSVSSHLNNDPSKKIFNLETTVVPKESLLIMPLHVKGNHWSNGTYRGVKRSFVGKILFHERHLFVLWAYGQKTQRDKKKENIDWVQCDTCNRWI
ncbi:ULP PROTEASE domain-containing protein, partial [Aphis craccivora]